MTGSQTKFLGALLGHYKRDTMPVAKSQKWNDFGKNTRIEQNVLATEASQELRYPCVSAKSKLSSNFFIAIQKVLMNLLSPSWTVL